MSELRTMLGMPFAHRGLHDAFTPENSLASFDLAARCGLAIELDVRLSRDGVPMVFHDADLARMCGVGGRLAETDAATLSRTRLADSGETVPTLAAALHTIGGRAPLMVDIKAELLPNDSRRRLLDAVAILVRCYPGPVAVVGLDPVLLAAFADRAPKVVRGQSAGIDPAYISRRWMRAVCRPLDDLWSLRVSRAHFVSFNVQRLPSNAIARLRERMPVVTWTVRTLGQLAIARTCADGVIVEDAALAAVCREDPQRSALSSSSGRRPA